MKPELVRIAERRVRNEKATPRPWHIELPKGIIFDASRTEVACVFDNPDTGMEEIGDEPSLYNGLLIVESVNEHHALKALEAAVRAAFVPIPDFKPCEGHCEVCNVRIALAALDALRKEGK